MNVMIIQYDSDGKFWEVTEESIPEYVSWWLRDRSPQDAEIRILVRAKRRMGAWRRR